MSSSKHKQTAVQKRIEANWKRRLATLKALRDGDKVGITWHLFGSKFNGKGTVCNRKPSGCFSVRFEMEGRTVVSKFDYTGSNKNLIGSRLVLPGEED